MGFRFTEIVYNDNTIISSFIAISLGWQYVYALFFFCMLCCYVKKTKTKSNAKIKADAGVYTAHITCFSALSFRKRRWLWCEESVCAHVSNGRAAETAFTLHSRRITICGPGS